MPTPPKIKPEAVIPTTPIAAPVVPPVAAPVAPIGTVPVTPIGTIPVTGIPVTGAAGTLPVSSASPTTTITVPNQSGTVVIQLVVTDDLGQQSAPSTVTITIQGGPTALLTASATVIKPGEAITLSGAGSSAVAPGTITNYAFSVSPTVA
jgi:hypothetical protein